MSDPIELLGRPDKWFLSAGDGIIFAPTFPVWLDAPGFWDAASVYQYAFAPLFTVTAVDHEGRAIGMSGVSRRWTPADLVTEYRLENGMIATEIRSVHPGGIFASEWRLRAARPARVHLVAWTAQEASTLDLTTVRWVDGMVFTRMLADRHHVPFPVTAELGCLGGATSWYASISEASANHPKWRYTPFAEKWRHEELPNQLRLESSSPSGLVYGAVHSAVDVAGDGGSATFAMRLSADGFRSNTDETQAAGEQGGTLAGRSRRRWQRLFSRAPSFRCSDPFFERYYWYRWYGLVLNTIAPGAGNYRHPTMCGGIGEFHQPIADSAQCHARELRWLRGPEHARGVFRTFFEHQREDGSVHGRIHVNHFERTDFYHADWGGALLAVDAVWPDDAFLREMYPCLARYAEWLVRARDADSTGMFDVIDQHETGQEYMSRYEAVNPHADRHGQDKSIRLKGIDATVYAYSIFRALERLCTRAGAPLHLPYWHALAERTAAAVRSVMWDSGSQMFFDVNPLTGRRTGVKAAVCFYPYFTDLTTDQHTAGLERHLLNPEEFWPPFPVPSSSVDDPHFSASAEWKGKRQACPWNGRVWPLTNSHMVEALGRTALRAPHLRAPTAQLTTRFVRMMFHNGELDRPNCYEHYNPFTGHESEYRGIDDRQHSWVADHIVQYVMGVRAHDEGVTVDPFPFALEFAEMTRIPARGGMLDVRIEGERFTVIADGSEHSGRMGTPIEFHW